MIRCYRNGELDSLVSVASDFHDRAVDIASSSRRAMQSPRDWETRRKRRRRAGGIGPVLVAHMPRTVTSLWDQSEMNAARWVRGAIASPLHIRQCDTTTSARGRASLLSLLSCSADRVPIANERWTSEINSGSESQSNPVCGEAEQRRRKRDFCSRGAGVSRAFRFSGFPVH